MSENESKGREEHSGFVPHEPDRSTETRRKNFHVAVEQDGILKLVPARAAIKFPPQVDQVYALFADNVEYRPWWVPLDGTLEPGRGEAGGVK